MSDEDGGGDGSSSCVEVRRSPCLLFSSIDSSVDGSRCSCRIGRIDRIGIVSDRVGRIV